MKTRVAVIGGGTSAEHDVSLASAAGISAALPERFEAVAFTIGRDGTWYHANAPVDAAAAAQLLATCAVMFPAVHGPGGEDGTLAAVADLLGIACVGSPVRAGATAMDKHLTRLLAQSIGVAVAPAQLVRPGQAISWPGTAVVVKPVAAGSSYGVGLVEREADLPAALAQAFACDEVALVEQYVTGREIDVAVAAWADGQWFCSPLLEIVLPAGAIFDTAGKYDGNARFLVPAEVTSAELEQISAAARAMYTALGCAGLVRVDFRLTAAGPVLIEVNTMPGLTEHSQVPRMCAAAAITYPQLLAHMIEEALARHRSRATAAGQLGSRA